MNGGRAVGLGSEYFHLPSVGCVAGTAGSAGELEISDLSFMFQCNLVFVADWINKIPSDYSRFLVVSGV